MSPALNHYLRPRNFGGVAVDTLLVLPALALAIRFSAPQSSPWPQIVYAGFGILLVTTVVIAILCMLRNRQPRNMQRLWSVNSLFLGVRSSLIAVGLLYALSLATPAIDSSRLFCIGGLIVLPWAMVGRIAVHTLWPDFVHPRIIIFGTGELAADVAKDLRSSAAGAARLVGFVKEETFETCSDRLEGPVLGSAAAIESVVAAHHASQVIVALDNRWGVLPVAALVRLRFLGIEVEDAQTTIARVTGRISLATVRPAWLIFTGGFRRSTWTLFIKRLIDVISSVMGLIITLPITVIVAIAIRLESDGPILYKQSRVGRRGQTFDVMKFRSMRVDAERDGAVWSTIGDSRVTRVGRFIRKYRIDELPQFVNILKGEMSLVGPRPERPVFVQDLRKLIDYYDERHSMRPGLTGWAQVRYPYGASVDDAYRKLEYDLFYLKHASMAFDLKIIAATVRVVVGGKLGR